MTKITSARLKEEIDYYTKSPIHSYSVEQIVKTLDGVEDWGLGLNLMPNKLKKKNKKIEFQYDPKNKKTSLGFSMSFNKKGGKIKTYAKGGGVRTARYKD